MRLVVVLLAVAFGCTLDGATVPDGQFSIANDQEQTFDFSFCSPVANVCGSNAGVCQQFLNQSVSAGQFSSQVAHFDAGLLTVEYTGGTVCPQSGQGRKTTIRVACDSQVFGLAVDSVVEASLCDYQILARSNGACGASGGACTYAVNGQVYDLSSVPVLSSAADQFGNSYNVSLCNPIACNASGVPSYICQHTHGAGAFGLGSVFGVVSTATYDAVLVYTNGDACFNGPRASTVTVLCGQVTKLLNATEPSVCHYTFFVSTPNACPANKKQGGK